MDVLSAYFKQFPKRILNTVDVIVIDMSRTYLNIGKIYFRKATIVIDKFHVIKHLMESMDTYRKRKQRSSTKYKNLYYQLRYVIGMRLFRLSDIQREKLTHLLDCDPELKVFHELKEQFLNIYDKSYDKEKARKKLSVWIKTAKRTNIPELQVFVKTYENWEEYILNYFDYRYTNGMIEGLNNKNKVIQRTSYGFRLFDTLRGKLLFELGRCA